jgi:Flp pilus assembly protein TadD
MSLLLDALKSTEVDVPAAIEPEEDPLDARATLELLAQKPLRQNPLALVPGSDNAAAQHSITGPRLFDELAAAPPSPEREPVSVAARTTDFVSPPVIAAAAPTSTRATATAPANARGTLAVAPQASRIKRYFLSLAALVIASVGMVGLWLWQSSSNTVVYPERGRTQQVATGLDNTVAPSTGAVQVSSARPAEQFGFDGNAPEIDLRNAKPQAAAAPGTAMPASGVSAPIATSPTRARAPAQTPEAHPSFLSVTPGQGLSSIDRHVEAGYRALSAGDVANAQHEYLAALELDPNNVDALLGAATVAARDGRSKAAAAAYTQVLKLEPGNPDATAAMAMLGSGGSTGESNESRLKILIAGDDGGRPALHAALGGVYAADARWSAAAQEYFTALSKDPGNPDLAFNVAASLDQNRNSSMALTYYRQALAFARQRPAQIDLNALERRISQLQARVETAAPAAPETP